MLLNKKKTKQTACLEFRRLYSFDFLYVALVAVFCVLPLAPSFAIETPLVKTGGIASEVSGHKIGAFTVKNSVDTAVVYDSNFLQSNNPDSDVIYLLSPRMNFMSNFARHQLNIDFGLERIEYQDSKIDSVTNGDIRVNALINVRKNLDLTIDLGAAAKHRARNAQDREFDAVNQPGVVTLEEPERYRSYNANLELKRKINTIEAAIGFGYSVEDFVNSDLTSNDSETLNVSATLSYKVLPNITIVTTAKGDFAEFTDVFEDADLNGVDDVSDRDNTNWSIDTEIDITLTSKTKLNLGLGYSKQIFHVESLGESDWLPNYSVGISWAPSAFWDFEATGTWSESGRDFEDGTTSSETESYSFSATYKPRRNLYLKSGFTYTQSVSSDNGDPDSTTDIYTYNMQIDHLINKALNFTFNYGFTEEEADEAEESFSQHVVQGRLKLQF